MRFCDNEVFDVMIQGGLHGAGVARSQLHQCFILYWQPDNNLTDLIKFRIAVLKMNVGNDESVPVQKLWDKHALCNSKFQKAVSEDVHGGLRPATADEPLSQVEWDELSKKFTSDQDEWPDILKSLAPACLRQLAHSGHEWWAQEADWIRDLITLAGTVHSPPSKKETTVLYQMLSGNVDYAAASLDQVDIIDCKDRDIVATVH
jgi:hypothetical protein